MVRGGERGEDASYCNDSHALRLLNVRLRVLDDGFSLLPKCFLEVVLIVFHLRTERRKNTGSPLAGQNEKTPVKLTWFSFARNTGSSASCAR
jgi:hypothetical protein